MYHNIELRLYIGIFNDYYSGILFNYYLQTNGTSQQIVNNEPSNGKWFDFNGRQITNAPYSIRTLSKGLYIIGHRKVIVK